MKNIYTSSLKLTLLVNLYFIPHFLNAQSDYFPNYGTWNYDVYLMNNNFYGTTSLYAYPQNCCNNEIRIRSLVQGNNINGDSILVKNDTIYSYNKCVKGRIVAFKHPRHGDSLTFPIPNSDPGNYIGLKVEFVGRITVPAGTFDSCFLIKDISHQPVPSFEDNIFVTESYFAPNIGIIKWVSSYKTWFNQSFSTLGTRLLSSYTPNNIFRVNHFHQLANKSEFAKKKLLAKDNTDKYFSLSADGSEASVFEYKFSFFSSALESSKLTVRIKENITQDTFEFGKLKTKFRSSDSLAFSFRHPQAIALNDALYKDSLFRTLTLELYDSIGGCVYKSIPIRVYRAPVLMVHGLWSNWEAFKKMEDELIKSKKYNNGLVFRADYQFTNQSTFESNKEVVPAYINDLIRKNLEENKCASGKVDLVCHSMGGILSRLYIQSSDYKNDVHKLITCNTPHWGSQFADFLRDSRNPWRNCLCVAMASKRKFCESGAVENLTANGQAIKSQLNINNTNSIKVSTHAIYTERDISACIDQILMPDDETCNLFWGLSFLNKNDKLKTVIRQIFASSNTDGIVSVNSQIGGLPLLNTTLVLNQGHAGSVANTNVISTVLDLLNKPLNNSKFSQYGFTSPPVEFRYTTPAILLNDIATDCDNIAKNYLGIKSPTRGQVINTGTSQRIELTRGRNIHKLNLTYDINNIDATSINLYNNDSIISLPNGFTKLGVQTIYAWGNDTINNIVYKDSVTINIIPNGNFDSISIYPQNLYIKKNTTQRFKTLGYKNSIAYDITDEVGLNFQFKTMKVSKNQYLLKGEQVGKDTLIVKYANTVSQPAFITIVENPDTVTIPIELMSFSGKTKKEKNLLTWQTASEKNCKGFYIQKSNDSKTWEEIDFVEGHGNSSGVQNYNWIDKYPLSISYYRLRQIDFDGKETLSKVVSVVREEQEDVTLFPNPTNGKVYIKTTKFQPKQVKVINSLGQVLIEKVQIDNEIDMENLPTGIYYIELWSENKRVQKRIFKN